MKHERDYLRTAVVAIAVVLLFGTFLFVPDAQGQTRFTRFRAILVEHNIDVLGDMDVDGTANLDVVDIDGAVDLDSTLTVAGAVDFDSTFEVDGTTQLDDAVTITAGGLDVTGDITLENDETISNDVNGVITMTATTIVNAANLVSTGTLDVQGGEIILESDDTIDNPSSGDITIAATTVTADGEGVVTGGLDVQGGDITLQSDDTIENGAAGTITVDATTVVADGNFETTGSLDVQGGGITLQNDETIGNAVNGTILLTADSVDVSAGLDVDGLTDLDTVDIDDLVNITRVTGTTGQYEDLVVAEWTNSAADASYGSNGIYASSNPIFDVQNAYGLRGRMDMRGATDGVDVNQLHAIDGLININETQVYTVNDNVSVIGLAMHGGTSGDIVQGRDLVSLNLLYGVWGPTADQNMDAQTNGILLVTHNSTYVDYGVQVQSSSDMDAGLFLNSHASNSTAKMDVGVEMTSGASDMIYGIDMEAADFTGADIVGDSGETLNNTTDTAWVIGGFTALEEATVIDLANGGTITPTASYQPLTVSSSEHATTDTTTAIADGPVAGAILILVNEDATYNIIIDDGANTKLSGNITLTAGNDDQLMLLWNGADWVGLSDIDN